MCAALSPALHASLIWDSNIGNPLPIAGFTPDGQNGLQSVNLAAGYAFPFQGTVYNSISVATSGFIWLGGTNGAQCCVLGTKAVADSLFQQGPARIAPGWAALRPDLGGSINFNEITDAAGARTDITFFQVATDPGNLNNKVTFQLQLYADGRVIFSYMTFDFASLGPNPATMIGLTKGFGDAVQSVDLASLQTGASLPNSFSDYLLVTNGLNLSGDSFVFTPTANGWQFATGAVPEPSTLISVGGILLLLVSPRIRRLRITKC